MRTTYEPVVTCDRLCLIMYDLGLYAGLFEILRDFIRLPGLYGFKHDGSIASLIAIVLVLLQIQQFCYRPLPSVPIVRLFCSGNIQQCARIDGIRW